jgi:RHS repeat-associated protein
VVARVEAIDQISHSKLTTEFSYHHGYWDGAEREFRGFGKVEQLDTETFEEYNQAGLHGEHTSFERVDQPQHFSPPTLTKTWFHQGPVGDEFGDWEEIDYSDEYWPGDDPFLERPAATTAFINSLPRRGKRDALRTLRGEILRTELYALDNSSRQEFPYTVTESSYSIREENPPNPDNLERLRIFFPHPIAARTTQWERGDEPLTNISFTEDYDTYGQPRVQISVAVPRGRDYRAAALPGDAYLATTTVTAYGQRDDEVRYIVDRVADATSFEIPNDGSSALVSLMVAILTGTAERRVIGQTLNFFDGPAFEGLSLGQLGDHGALTRTETLVLTEAILQEAYRSGTPLTEPPEVPPYFVPDSEPVWTADYPDAFRSQIPPLAGYLFHPGGSGHERGYFVISAQHRYDFQDDSNAASRGLLFAMRDPLGRDTTIGYDDFDLLPIQVFNSAGLTTRVVHDYRVFLPSLVTDANGNRSAFSFTPMGMLASNSVMGKESEVAGDSLDVPGTRLEYDFLAFANRQQPISLRTIVREHHVHDIDVSLPERDATIETIEYSDGFGRLIQTRTQAEDVAFGDLLFGDDIGLPIDQSVDVEDAVGRQFVFESTPRVAVSGWQRFDNKGRVIERYEPFFSVGWEYSQPVDAELGQRATLFYDPRGQLIRTLNPDGSEQRVIYGIPLDLSNPEQFSPTPWEIYTYDPNDNAGRTHTANAVDYQHHWNTPASAVLDAVGHTIETTERNGPDSVADWYTIRSTYDLRGNLSTVTDALGRRAFQYIYDLANNPLRTESIDAGARFAVLSAVGNIVEQRDSKGAIVLQTYDVLNRPIRIWACDRADQGLTLRQQLIYGDDSNSGLTIEQARTANLLGALFHYYDEAGRQIFESYDFKGNLREKIRQVIGDAVILGVFTPPPPDWQVEAFRVDWQPREGTTLSEHAADQLDPFQYRISMVYDALNRVSRLRYPEDVENTRRELRPHYNNAGTLERVELNEQTFVERIAYNAKGQRTLIALGNGVMTRYTYDPLSFRLRRMRSERYTQPDDQTYHPNGPALQDFALVYDLAGNITTISDRTPESGIPNTLLGSNALDRVFTYDPIYRLLSATGRECDIRPPLPPWFDEPRCIDITRTRAYTERYQYDSLGNILSLQHQVNGGGFTREFALPGDSNRLQSVTVGGNDFDYGYDANGNMIRETTSRHFEWDYGDQLSVYRTQTTGVEPSVHAHYLYDAGGQRVKKLVRRQGGQFEVTVYIDSVFEHQRNVSLGEVLENNTLHVVDNQDRIALVRVGEPFSDDTTPRIKFQLGDHLKSSNVIADALGELVSREEFTPYGETSFGSFARKRYRYTGNEKDEESGLCYHGVRYYVPYLARWASSDPAGMIDGIALYSYARSNPINLVDKAGTNAQPPSPPSNHPNVNKCYDEPNQRYIDATLEMERAGNITPEHADALLKELTTKPLQLQKNEPGMSAMSDAEYAASMRAAEERKRHAQHVLDGLAAATTNIIGAGVLWYTNNPTLAHLAAGLMPGGKGGGASAARRPAARRSSYRPGRRASRSTSSRSTSSRSTSRPAREGTRIHEMTKQSQPKGRYGEGFELWKQDESAGGKKRPDEVWVNHKRKIVVIVDIYTGGKKDIHVSGGWESLKHWVKSLSYVQEPDIQSFIKQGYEVKVTVAKRQWFLEPKHLH